MSFFFSFLSFSIFLHFWERERGYIKLGIRRNGPKVYLSYFDGFLWRIFLPLRALLLPRVLDFSSLRNEPCPTTNFLFSFFRWREEGATSVLGSQPIIWLLPSSFPCQAIRVRSQSTHILYFDGLLLLIHARGIVVILFLSSQWDTTWQKE